MQLWPMSKCHSVLLVPNSKSRSTSFTSDYSPFLPFSSISGHHAQSYSHSNRLAPLRCFVVWYLLQFLQIWPRNTRPALGAFLAQMKAGRKHVATIHIIDPHDFFNLPTLWWNYSMYSFYNILYLFITWRLRTQQENPLKSAPFQYTFSCGCWTRDAMQECRRESKWTMNERILNPRWLRVASSYLTA